MHCVLATMQGGDITGIGNQIGFFLVKAGGALIDNMALLFVIGVGVGMSDKHDGTGGLAALASWLMITTSVIYSSCNNYHAIYRKERRCNTCI